MLGPRWTYLFAAIGGGCGERKTCALQQGAHHFVTRLPKRNCRKPGRDRTRDSGIVSHRQDQRQGARPESLDQIERAVVEVCKLSCLLEIAHMHDQRIEIRTALRGVYSCDSVRAVRSCGKPVNRLGRNRDKASFSEDVCRAGHARFVGRQDFRSVLASHPRALYLMHRHAKRIA